MLVNLYYKKNLDDLSLKADQDCQGELRFEIEFSCHFFIIPSNLLKYFRWLLGKV